MDGEIPIPELTVAPPPSLAARVIAPRKSRTMLVALLAFIGGVSVAIWAAPAIRDWVHSLKADQAEGPLQGDAANASSSTAANAQGVSALEARTATLSARMADIAQQAENAGDNAGRAEALLISFAARRMLDRGAPLGYLEGELRLRFADAQPRAVATIINAAASPVTIPDLQMRLGELTPALAGADAKADWWDAARRELSSLIIVRKASAPSPEPRKVIERAQMLLASGRVDAALAEIERMRNHDKADAWLQMARQYNEARRALDVIEAAAILEPKRIPIPATDEAEPVR